MTGNDQSGLGGATSIRTAGFWRRFVAFTIDAAIAATAAVLAALLTGILSPARFPARHGNLFDYLIDVWNSQPGLIAGPLVLFVLFLAMQDALGTVLWGTTAGRRAVGLRLFDASGEAPGPGRAVLRSLLRFVSLGLCGVGCLWCVGQHERRTWHDLLSGTWLGSRDGSVD